MSLLVILFFPLTFCLLSSCHLCYIRVLISKCTRVPLYMPCLLNVCTWCFTIQDGWYQLDWVLLVVSLHNCLSNILRVAQPNKNSSNLLASNILTLFLVISSVDSRYLEVQGTLWNTPIQLQVTAWYRWLLRQVWLYCPFGIFWKVVFCLALYTEEVNLQTFVMI